MPTNEQPQDIQGPRLSIACLLLLLLLSLPFPASQALSNPGAQPDEIRAVSLSSHEIQLPSLDSQLPYLQLRFDVQNGIEKSVKLKSKKLRHVVILEIPYGEDAEITPFPLGRDIDNFDIDIEIEKTDTQGRPTKIIFRIRESSGVDAKISKATDSIIFFRPQDIDDIVRGLIKEQEWQKLLDLVSTIISYQIDYRPAKDIVDSQDLQSFKGDLVAKLEEQHVGGGSEPARPVADHDEYGQEAQPSARDSRRSSATEGKTSVVAKDDTDNPTNESRSPVCDVEIFLERGKEHFEHKRYDIARNLFEVVTQITADESCRESSSRALVEADYHLGSIALLRSDFSTALQHFTSVERKTSGAFADTAFYQGFSYYELGEVASARQKLRQYLDGGPASQDLVERAEQLLGNLEVVESLARRPAEEENHFSCVTERARTHDSGREPPNGYERAFSDRIPGERPMVDLPPSPPPTGGSETPDTEEEPATTTTDPDEELGLQRTASYYTDELSQYVFRGYNRSSLRFSELMGKAVILHFWASFCAPCRDEMPSLLKFLDEEYPVFEDRGIRFITITNDDPLRDAELRAFIDEVLPGHGEVLPIYQDGDYAINLKLDFEAGILPATIVLDSDGFARHVREGLMDWQEANFIALIDSLASN